MDQSNEIHFWLYSFENKMDLNTQNEIKWSKKLGKKRSLEYLLSRSILRQSLSDLFNIKPFEVPILAKPGSPPILNENYGYVSISHCKDAILVGWSKEKIGIDIESKDRKINSELILKKIFSYEEIVNFQTNYPISRKTVLLGWTCKESAIKWAREKSVLYAKNWAWDLKRNIIKNKKEEISLELINYHYKNWIITAAYKKDDNLGKKNGKFCLSI